MKEIKEATNDFQSMLEIIEKNRLEFTELHCQYKDGFDVKAEMEKNINYETFLLKEAEKKAHQIYELLKKLKNN